MNLVQHSYVVTNNCPVVVETILDVLRTQGYVREVMIQTSQNLVAIDVQNKKSLIYSVCFISVQIPLTVLLELHL